MFNEVELVRVRVNDGLDSISLSDGTSESLTGKVFNAYRDSAGSYTIIYKDDDIILTWFLSGDNCEELPSYSIPEMPPVVNIPKASLKDVLGDNIKTFTVEYK